MSSTYRIAAQPMPAIFAGVEACAAAGTGVINLEPRGPS
jgi:hypothetical protein